MYRCTSCKSTKIKTRSNKVFGKSRTVPVECKNCKATTIEYVDPKTIRRGRGRR